MAGACVPCQASSGIAPRNTGGVKGEACSTSNVGKGYAPSCRRGPPHLQTLGHKGGGGQEEGVIKTPWRWRLCAPRLTATPLRAKPGLACHARALPCLTRIFASSRFRRCVPDVYQETPKANSPPKQRCATCNSKRSTRVKQSYAPESSATVLEKFERRGVGGRVSSHKVHNLSVHQAGLIEDPKDLKMDLKDLKLRLTRVDRLFTR